MSDVFLDESNNESNNDNDLIGETNAMIWAERFTQRVNENPEIATDVDTMLAWFSGAIMAGYDLAINGGRFLV